MVWKASLAIAASIVVSTPAAAEDGRFTTSQDVLDTCTSGSSANQMMCFGYIEGLARRDELARWMAPATAYLCELPAGVTKGQMQAIVVRYIREHPETWHFDGASQALMALKKAFCTK